MAGGAGSAWSPCARPGGGSRAGPVSAAFHSQPRMERREGHQAKPALYPYSQSHPGFLTLYSLNVHFASCCRKIRPSQSCGCKSLGVESNKCPDSILAKPLERVAILRRAPAHTCLGDHGEESSGLLDAGS